MTDNSDPVITVEAFCTQLSGVDKRVELIGAFHNAQVREQHFFDTGTNYQTRYAAFGAEPA
jgi:hypothetical protein